MLDFLYQSGWGAFSIMLFFQIPFLIFFFYIVYRKAAAGRGIRRLGRATDVSRMEWLWLSIVVVLFVGVNVLSIKYMPTISTAQAAATEKDIHDVECDGSIVVLRNFGQRSRSGPPGSFLGQECRHSAWICGLSSGRASVVHHDADTRRGAVLADPYVHRAGHLQGSLPGILWHSTSRDAGSVGRYSQQRVTASQKRNSK